MTFQLPYDPKLYKRELSPYYIGPTEKEIKLMSQALSLKDIEEIFSHIPKEFFHRSPMKNFPKRSYLKVAEHLKMISEKNDLYTSFIGDGFKHYSPSKIVPFISSLRGLLTAYTPYQPERSQGTLNALWMYSSLLSQLTGFEAINSSMYERSTCLFEAIKTTLQLKRSASTIIIPQGVHPKDLVVLKTLIRGTDIKIKEIPLDPHTGLLDHIFLLKTIKNNLQDLAGLVCTQMNHLGHLEDVHAITDLAKKYQLISIAIIDPILLSKGGLCPPSEYGTAKEGVDIIVAEGQHLATDAHFGGPGLGIFGVRYNKMNKRSIRATPGRFVGKGKDLFGKVAKAIILSTREQHIRREKANSNICSNQSFVAILAGAALLEKGEEGMRRTIAHGRTLCLEFVRRVKSIKNVLIPFKKTPFFNEIIVELKATTVKELLSKGQKYHLHIGVDASKRLPGNRQLLLISFFDRHSKEDLEKLIEFFHKECGALPEQTEDDPVIPKELQRLNPPSLPTFEYKDIVNFYKDLNKQNIGVDEGIYPLGSCTMKYNPYLNEYAASLRGFREIHPQVPLENAQGCLEILYNIQEMFKDITGLDTVTTEPVAGAQGELVGLKMFQAYHKFQGENYTRKFILIPRTAHGTNPASASVAGILNKRLQGGILSIKAQDSGELDLEDLKKIIKNYNTQIIGIMITNPNTSGIFETNFKLISDLIHNIGGLVYMDGANMNAIAGQIDLKKMGVDAVHNNLHKTWSIPHGGGGPGDAILAVSEKLSPYLPGIQVIKDKKDTFSIIHPSRSIGSMHRHWGNFAHKVRCYTYLSLLGERGIRSMSQAAVLSSRYIEKKITPFYSILPTTFPKTPRMHEFIITLKKADFTKLEKIGFLKSEIIPKIGKLFLDFGIHSPTVAFPESFGLMIEPTESFTLKELDRFIEVLIGINTLITQFPEVLWTTPHFTPVRKIDEVDANKNIFLNEKIQKLPKLSKDLIDPGTLQTMKISEIIHHIKKAHQNYK